MSLVHAGKYKVEGHPFAPLDKEARGEMQRSVNLNYQHFVHDVARNRNVRVSKVESDFGQGRQLHAQAAVRAGMADGVSTLEALLNRLGVKMTGNDGGRLRGAGASEVEELRERLDRKMKLGSIA